MAASVPERLFALYSLLVSRDRPISRSRIRESIDAYRRAISEAAFERTFERDKSALRRLGMRLKTSQVMGETVYSLDRDKLWLAGEPFTPSERLTLGIAARLWSDPEYARDVDRAVRRLGYRDHADSMEPNAKLTPRLVGGGENLDIVLEALAQGYEVEFFYRGAESLRSSERRVRPWGVGQRFGHWYLGGWDADRDAFRMFRLSRIGRVVAKETSLPGADSGFSMSRALEGVSEAPNPRIRLSFPTPAWPMIMDWVEAGAGVRRPDPTAEGFGADDAEGGDFSTAEVDVPEVRELIRCIAELGGAVGLTVPRHTGFTEAEVRDRAKNLTAKALTRQTQVSSAYNSNCEVQPPRKERNREASDRRFVRMVDLASYLGSHTGCTTAELAEHLGVPQRQVTRDLHALANAGDELLGSAYLRVDAQDDVVHVELPRDLDQPLNLAPEQTLRLLLALQLLGEISPDLDEATRAIGRKLADTANQARVGAEQLSIHIEPETAERLAAVREAASSGESIEILYRSRSQSTAAWRAIRPLDVYSNGSTWYVTASAARSGGLRTFRVESIRKVREPQQADEAPSSTRDHGATSTGETAEEPTTYLWINGSRPELSTVVGGSLVGYVNLRLPDGAALEGHIRKIRVLSWLSLYRLMIHHGGDLALWQSQTWEDSWRQELRRRGIEARLRDPRDEQDQGTRP